MDTFEGLNVSSKFAICGLPLRVDSYKTCSFGCRYCFANGRKIMEFEKNLMVANIGSIERRLKRIFKDNDYDTHNFLDSLIANGITWHCGGMSDPFQPINEKLKVTNRIIDITNEYNIEILFSTKSNTIHGANIKPNLHTFQLSVSNVHNRRDIEPNVPDIESRYRLFATLKERGFKVGIRIQPFIPNVSDLAIVEKFKDADHFTIEGLKVIPQDGEQKDYCFGELKMKKSLFTQMGLLNMLPEMRYELYKPFVEYFNANGISYSISDNDMRWLGNNICCCGDKLANHPTGFDVTAMIMNRKNRHWTLGNVLQKVGCYRQCKAKDLFTSNRTGGAITVEDFYRQRFKQQSSPFSPKFQYCHQPTLF